MTKPKEKKKVIWKPGAPEEWGTKAHFISNGYSENRDRIFKRVFKVPQKQGIELSQKLREQFENVVKSFYFDYTKLKRPPSASELTFLFENLKNSAEAFARSLENIRDSRIKRTIPLHSGQKTDPVISKLIEDAERWEMAARIKLLELQPKQGPKKPPFVNVFILNLADIYEQATGKEAATGYYDRASNQIRGLFPNFIASVLNCIDKQIYHSGRSLVENIINPALTSRSKTSQKKQ